MRLPWITAALSALYSITYKYFTQLTKKDDGSALTQLGKGVVSWFAVLVILGFLTQIKATASIGDLICYVIIAIVVLNDGYDSIKAVVE